MHDSSKNRPPGKQLEVKIIQPLEFGKISKIQPLTKANSVHPGGSFPAALGPVQNICLENNAKRNRSKSTRRILLHSIRTFRKPKATWCRDHVHSSLNNIFDYEATSLKVQVGNMMSK